MLQNKENLNENEPSWKIFFDLRSNCNFNIFLRVDLPSEESHYVILGFNPPYQVPSIKLESEEQSFLIQSTFYLASSPLYSIFPPSFLYFFLFLSSYAS